MSLKKNDAVSGFIVPRKKVLNRFSINEISAVDTPAMEPALVTLMKRHSRHSKSAAAHTYEHLFSEMVDCGAVRKRLDDTHEQLTLEGAGHIVFTADDKFGKLVEIDDSAFNWGAVEVGKVDQREEGPMAKNLSADEFEMVAKAVQLRHGCSPRDASVAVRLAIQDGTLGKQLSGQEVATIARLNTEAKAEKSGATFEQLVAGICKSKGGSRADAIRQARRENPTAFDAWQGQ